MKQFTERKKLRNFPSGGHVSFGEENPLHLVRFHSVQLQRDSERPLLPGVVVYLLDEGCLLRRKGDVCHVDNKDIVGQIDPPNHEGSGS